MSPSSRILWVVLLAVVWLAGAVGSLFWFRTDHGGWDLRAYRRAERLSEQGGDLYRREVQAELSFYAKSPGKEYVEPPLPYLYPPATLPVVRLLGVLRLPHALYWAIYVCGLGAIVYAGMQFAEPRERTVVWLAGPFALYLPALLYHDSVLGGNLSYVVYGAVLLAAWRGWRRGRWTCFYVLVGAASCIKPPWLTLLAVPVLSAPGQWVPALGIASASIAGLLLQLSMWPQLVTSWLLALRLEPGYHGFGLAPAGIAAQWRFGRGLPYAGVALAVGFVADGAVLACLVPLARWYRRGLLSLERFTPVLLLGVWLLNPRLKDYDAMPITIAIGLILWRVLDGSAPFLRLAAWCVAVASANLIAVSFDPFAVSWNRVACLLVCGSFAGGVWDCSKQRRSARICTAPAQRPVWMNVPDGDVPSAG